MFNTQMGMLTLREGDFSAAISYLSSATEAKALGKYDNFQVFVLTMAAFAHQKQGNAEEADRLLARARRDLQRARVNGVDNPDIDYNEAVMMAMGGNVEGGLQKLQEAYEGGFRLTWLLTIDPRIDALRDRPEFIALRDRIDRDVQSALDEVRLLALAAN